MKKIMHFIVFGGCLLASGTRAVEPVVSVSVQPNQAVLEVKGMVCGRCAKAVHKQLSEVPGLDRSQLQDGLHIDLDKKQIVMALLPGKSVDCRKVHQAIKESDCELIGLHRRLQGRLEKKGGRLVLREDGSGQVYPISFPPEKPRVRKGNSRDEFQAWYRVATMACTMGNLDESKKFLNKAVELGGNEVMLMALGDASLEKLWVGQQATLQVEICWPHNPDATKGKSLLALAERVIEVTP
jgi:copper chaperone CopZ